MRRADTADGESGVESTDSVGSTDEGSGFVLMRGGSWGAACVERWPPETT
jgi:hypothetical protein